MNCLSVFDHFVGLALKRLMGVVTDGLIFKAYFETHYDVNLRVVFLTLNMYGLSGKNLLTPIILFPSQHLLAQSQQSKHP